MDDLLDLPGVNSWVARLVQQNSISKLKVCVESLFHCFLVIVY